MHNIIRWIVPPLKRNIGIINAGIGAFCDANGFLQTDMLKLQLCTEGVFSYCVENIRTKKQSEEIAVCFLKDAEKFKILIQHAGPGGEWDSCLRPQEKKPVRRTSFSAMGLFIAIEMTDSLTFDSQLELTSGRTLKTYEMIFCPDISDKKQCT